MSMRKSEILKCKLEKYIQVSEESMNELVKNKNISIMNTLRNVKELLRVCTGKIKR